MNKRRKEEGFNLAFLDVMACGLGAVILILILVKFSSNTDVPVEELARLQQELAALENQSDDLAQSLQDEAQITAAKTATVEALRARIQQLTVQQEAVSKALQDQITVVADLDSAIAAVAPQTADDVISTPNVQEESYLLGLKVEGKGIGILVDTSASMVDEALIGIIRRKIGSDTDKRQGKKWQRTLRIARWLLARLPENAEFSVMAFNNKAQVMGKRAINRAGSTDDLQAVISDINKLTPSEGTNLEVALKHMARTFPNMTDLYVITDGLPTLVEKNSGFPQSRKCKPIEGLQSTITGECRMEAFAHTLRTNPLAGVRTNIILLPLEGDPTAPGAYWSWAERTQGTFIAPASTWP
ncbi:VWA domain-containing protein [Agaribacter flavus]|uniref:VWA domain-containing protein n=1 Tax=Agaribacter flavus TaxID=1902781 RepID=A0ABV7FRH8_9ALTE